MGVLGGYLDWKVVLKFWFGHPKCHFQYPPKRPKLVFLAILGKVIFGHFIYFGLFTIEIPIEAKGTQNSRFPGSKCSTLTYLFSGSKMQPGTAMCFLNFYTLVFWTPLLMTLKGTFFSQTVGNYCCWAHLHSLFFSTISVARLLLHTFHCVASVHL